MTHTCCQPLVHPHRTAPLGLAAVPSLERAAAAAVLWPKGKTIRIGFLNGDPGGDQHTLRLWVINAAATWQHYGAGLAFDFIEGAANADVTVNFLPRSGAGYGTYSSALGTEAAAFIADGEPSCDLIFDPSDQGNTAAELQRVCLHELGHVLGLIHEHERPDRPIVWDVPAVVKYYRELTGGSWTDEEIRDQVLQSYASPIVAETAFDPQSIMMYPFPAGLAVYGDTGEPFSIGWNETLSQLDILAVSRLYPK
jgi:hypothetical protein